MEIRAPFPTPLLRSCVLRISIRPKRGFRPSVRGPDRHGRERRDALGRRNGLLFQLDPLGCGFTSFILHVMIPFIVEECDRAILVPGAGAGYCGALDGGAGATAALEGALAMTVAFAKSLVRLCRGAPSGPARGRRVTGCWDEGGAGEVWRLGPERHRLRRHRGLVVWSERNGLRRRCGGLNHR